MEEIEAALKAPKPQVPSTGLTPPCQGIPSRTFPQREIFCNWLTSLAISSAVRGREGREISMGCTALLLRYPSLRPPVFM